MWKAAVETDGGRPPFPTLPTSAVCHDGMGRNLEHGQVNSLHLLHSDIGKLTCSVMDNAKRR